MKTVLLFTAIITGINAQSQTIDSVVLGPGYANESYYNFENGEVVNVNNANWDLAFDLSPFGATIRMNRRTDLLFIHPGTSADWATLDTTGHLGWDQYIDGYTSWSEGALNAPANISDPADLGWGMYNSITHITDGSKLFVIKLDDDSYRKLFVEQLASGAYTFKYANIDGSNEVSETITKSTYSGKNFIYYSLLNEAVVDREPLSTEWDIVFTNYVLELAPGYFSGVTGALSNSTFQTMSVAESNDVPVNDANMNANIYDGAINTIGYDWKYFDMGTFSYVILDSLCYFVKDENDEVWKLVFTGFGGGANGKIYFTKEQVAFASLNETNQNGVSVFPVPASNQITVSTIAYNAETIIIHNAAGQIVYSQNCANENSTTTFSVENFENGIYLLQLITSEKEIITKKISVQH